MEYFYYALLLVVVLLLYIIITYLINHYKEKVIYDEMNVLCHEQKYTFTKVTKQKYDAIIANDSFEMYIKVLNIPANSSVTINSHKTWCLRFGGGKRKGHSYPNKRYLNELIPFLNFNPTNDKKQIIRVIVFYPSTEVILKYLNESEIIEIHPKDLSYGFKAIKYSDFYTCFNELLITKNKNQ